MAVITDPKTGIIVSAPKGSDQWTDAKKARRWLTWALSRVVSDTACATLPASPVEGQAVIVSGGTNANAIAWYSTDLGAWEYMAPWAGLVVQDTTGADWIYSGSAWAVRPSGGGTVTGLPSWVSGSLDTPPAAPNAWDDEFDGSALASEWAWDNGATISAFSVGGGLLQVVPTAPETQTSVLYKPISGEFEIAAKLRLAYVNAANYFLAGLAAGSPSGGWLTWNVVPSINDLARHDFSSSTTRTDYQDSTCGLGQHNQPYYLKLKHSGGQLQCYGSPTGRSWTALGSVQAVGAGNTLTSVDRAGLSFGGAATPHCTVEVEWIRRLS